MDDKKKPTPSMEEYIKLHFAYKDIESQKDILKNKVMQEFKNDPSYPEIKYEGITYYVSEPIRLNDDRFFAWCAETFPEHIEKLKADKIDYEKFESLESKGLIEYEEIPETVYDVGETHVVKVTRRKKLRIKRGDKT